MVEKRKGVYGPAKEAGIIFIDDLHMPQKENFGAQPPIELLRQWMDYGGWYDLRSKEKEFRIIENVRLVGVMSLVDGSSNVISARYTSHFNAIYVAPSSSESMSYIFTNIMDWMFLKNATPAYS